MNLTLLISKDFNIFFLPSIFPTFLLSFTPSFSTLSYPPSLILLPLSSSLAFFLPSFPSLPSLPFLPFLSYFHPFLLFHPSPSLLHPVLSLLLFSIPSPILSPSPHLPSLPLSALSLIFLPRLPLPSSYLHRKWDTVKPDRKENGEVI